MGGFFCTGNARIEAEQIEKFSADADRTTTTPRHKGTCTGSGCCNCPFCDERFHFIAATFYGWLRVTLVRSFCPPPSPSHRFHTEPLLCSNLMSRFRLVVLFFQAHEEAAARGEGCAVLDGSLVERLHAENARRVIELHESIAALEAGQDSGS